MIKKRGFYSIVFITITINTSLRTCTIANVWKTARIIPLPKPGKDPNKSFSFRPISLLSPVAKLIEALCLPIICRNVTFAIHQHGFRSNHSTTTVAFLQISIHQTRPCERTLLVALDLHLTQWIRLCFFIYATQSFLLASEVVKIKMLAVGALLWNKRIRIYKAYRSTCVCVCVSDTKMKHSVIFR